MSIFVASSKMREFLFFLSLLVKLLFFLYAEEIQQTEWVDIISVNKNARFMQSQPMQRFCGFYQLFRINKVEKIRPCSYLTLCSFLLTSNRQPASAELYEYRIVKVNN